MGHLQILFGQKNITINSFEFSQYLTKNVFLDFLEWINNKKYQTGSELMTYRFFLVNVPTHCAKT